MTPTESPSLDPGSDLMANLPSKSERGKSQEGWLSKYWIFWLVLAFVVYETTSQPAWAILIACIKVGLGEFGMAGWLIRYDPDRTRVLAKAFIYISHGLWKIALTGGIVGIGVMIIMQIVQPNGGPGMLQVLRGVGGALFALLVGFLLSTFFTIVACLLAVCTGAKLYVGSAVDAAKDGHYWPPVSLQTHWSNLGLDNFTRWLILTAFLLIFGIGGAVIMNKDRRAKLQGIRPRGTDLPLACLGLGCLGAYLYLNNRVVARRPEESWQLPDWAFQPQEISGNGGEAQADWPGDGRI